MELTTKKPSTFVPGFSAAFRDTAYTNKEREQHLDIPTGHVVAVSI
jgi:hypothetical protein